MKYTIKQVAQLSGVSIRTLRFYDEIGILKPAFYGENGYRFYENEQLLILQQILFYRELEFTLGEIKQTLLRDDFNKLDALNSHKKVLEGKLKRIKNLLSTLNKTIANLSGENTMTTKEIYFGFSPEDLPRYDKIAITELGEVAEKFIKLRKEITKDWGKTEWDKTHQDWCELCLELTSALEKDMSPTSVKVQEIIKKQYKYFIKIYPSPTKEEFLSICKINCTHPEYKKIFDFYHPKLAEFTREAMEVFANNNLS